MDQQAIALTIVGMALVTYLPRLLPLWFLTSRTLPPVIIAWLRYVPVAVLAALLLPSLMVQAGRIDLSLRNLDLWAALPALLVALKTRSFFATVVTGMSVVALARYVLASQ